MKVDGRCYCGHITYVAEVDPNLVEICHCTDCQTFSSSAFRIVVPTERATFRLLTGALTEFVKTGESGRKRVQTFCPHCGTAIYSGPVDEKPGTPTFLGLRVGAIQQRAQLPPKEQYWTRSRRHWLGDLDSLKTFETE